MKVAVVADTHLRAGSPRRMPRAALRVMEGADAILHAGDVLDEGTLRTIQELAPTYAVLGNNDRDLVGALPVTLSVDLGGVNVAMIHDSGARSGREARMRRRFPGADLVVFGHSHIPVDAPDPGGQHLFNPGSPTQRRRQPHHTVGLLTLAGGEVVRHRIQVIDN
jgi:putative phosphoesterase